MRNQESKWIWLNGRTYNIDLMRSISFQESINVYNKIRRDSMSNEEKEKILNMITYLEITWHDGETDLIAIPDSYSGKLMYERLSNLTSKCKCDHVAITEEEKENIYREVADLQMQLEEIKNGQEVLEKLDDDDIRDRQNKEATIKANEDRL